jgi:hypothetical protein
MSDMRSEFRVLALNYKTKSKEDLDALNLDNQYFSLLNDMRGLAYVGLFKYRIMRDQFDCYGFSVLSIRDKLIKRLEDDGFTVLSEKGNPLLLRNSYIEISW